MKPGSDMPCGCASSVTVAPPCSPSRWSTPRRVASDSAQKTRSRITSSFAIVRRLAASPFRQPETDIPPGNGCSMLTRLPSVSKNDT